VSATAIAEERCNLVHILDITERKQAEEKAQVDNRLLEEKVKERTLALEETNMDLENFIYAVTHDLRVPLQNLNGLTAALNEELGNLPPGSDVSNILEMIGQNALKMDELVVDLLAFSKAGRQELTKTKIDMGAVVKEVIAELVPFYKQHEISWQLSGLPEATGDYAALHQVWLNLVSNALKYSSKNDHIRIEISGYEDEGKTCYQIKDNGSGYDARYADKLFNLFQRLHHPDEYEGSGMGLASSHRLVQKHGGFMWSESTLGQGATFSFCLPK
jgi:light-regulated signal transduction histidine kinase (bacteriophytochrome)